MLGKNRISDQLNNVASSIIIFHGSTTDQSLPDHDSLDLPHVDILFQRWLFVEVEKSHISGIIKRASSFFKRSTIFLFRLEGLGMRSRFSETKKIKKVFGAKLTRGKGKN